MVDRNNITFLLPPCPPSPPPLLASSLSLSLPPSLPRSLSVISLLVCPQPCGVFAPQSRAPAHKAFIVGVRVENGSLCEMIPRETGGQPRTSGAKPRARG